METKNNVCVTDKLCEFFDVIRTLIHHNKIWIGRDYFFRSESSLIRNVGGKDTETLDFSFETSVLYIDLHTIYPLYKKVIGEKSALKKEDLIMLFNSNIACFGYNRAVRYSWTENEFIDPDGTDIGDGFLITNKDKWKVSGKARAASAYMFNYDMIKNYFGIDLKHINNDNVIEAESKTPIIMEKTLEQMIFSILKANSRTWIQYYVQKESQGLTRQGEYISIRTHYFYGRELNDLFASGFTIDLIRSQKIEQDSYCDILLYRDLNYENQAKAEQP